MQRRAARTAFLIIRVRCPRPRRATRARAVRVRSNRAATVRRNWRRSSGALAPRSQSATDVRFSRRRGRHLPNRARNAPRGGASRLPGSRPGLRNRSQGNGQAAPFANAPSIRDKPENSGRDWEDACLAFEKNERPSLTASAAQVRQKIYASSVGLWRPYSNELEPLARALRARAVRVRSNRAATVRR